MISFLVSGLLGLALPCCLLLAARWSYGNALFPFLIQQTSIAFADSWVTAVLNPIIGLLYAFILISLGKFSCCLLAGFASLGSLLSWVSVVLICYDSYTGCIVVGCKTLRIYEQQDVSFIAVMMVFVVWYLGRCFPDPCYYTIPYGYLVQQVPFVFIFVLDAINGDAVGLPCCWFPHVCYNENMGRSVVGFQTPAPIPFLMVFLSSSFPLLLFLSWMLAAGLAVGLPSCWFLHVCYDENMQLLKSSFLFYLILINGTSYMHNWIIGQPSDCYCHYLGQIGFMMTTTKHPATVLLFAAICSPRDTILIMFAGTMVKKIFIKWLLYRFVGYDGCDDFTPF